MEFESLGDNCEFGIAQRYCGVDPLGLFRFSFCSLSTLRNAFAANLAPLGDDDDLDVVVADDEEFLCRSRHYGFVTHTDTYESKTTIEKVRARESKKRIYLRDRLLSDLTTCEKIFVRKCNHTEPATEIADLARSLRRHGPNILLWVVSCDADHPHGSVEIIGEGLLKGYIRHFASYGNALNVDIEAWISVCLTAFGLARRIKGIKETPPRLTRNPILSRGSHWQAISLGSVDIDIDGPPLLVDDCPVSRLTHLDDATDETWLAVAPIGGQFEVGALLVFCTWIWIPSMFAGKNVTVVLADRPIHHTGRADLSRRDVWQQVWSGVKLLDACADVNGLIRADGKKGDVLYCTAWELQDGSIPNEITHE